MQEAAVVRRATREAVEAVGPERLHSRISSRLDRSAMTAGVFTIRCARAVLEQRRPGAVRGTVGDTEAPLSDEIATRAAGVQLIHEGLDLTRTLAQDPPWLADQKAQADLDILIADILVARGFHLLARTEAADEAVATVQAFGRDQTLRDREGTDPTAGTTAVGGQPSPRLREFAASIARRAAADGEIPDVPTDHLSGLVSVDSTSGDGVRTSADH